MSVEEPETARFSTNPGIPPMPSDEELNEFYIMAATVMHGHPLTPPVFALKAAISIIFAMRLEVERLRHEYGEETTDFEGSIRLLKDFIDKSAQLG